MGLIRGGLLFVVTVLLFLSFLVGNVFLTLNLSLDYDNVQPELTPVIRELAESEIDLNSIVNEKFESMELYCQNNSNSEVSDFVFNEYGYTFVIPCDIVFQGPVVVVDKGIENIVNEIYYKDYDCDFLDCFGRTEMPFFLISAKAKDYWQSKFYFSLLISFVLIGLMFFLVEQKFNLPVVVGILFIISSLPFMKLNWLLSFFSNSLYLQFFTVFFTKAYMVFLITFILGIVILALGIILKFFKFGFWISNLFDKFKKKSTGKSKEKREKIIEKSEEKIVKEEKNKKIIKKDISKSKEKRAKSKKA